MEIIWKDVVGYEGLYMVSNLGAVKSLEKMWVVNNALRKKPETIMKQAKDSNGYYQVWFSKNGSKKNMLVHRLVANAFIENPLQKKDVNHINGIKTDNSLNNLEWCNGSENIQHAIKNKLIKTGKESPFYGMSGEKSKSSKKVFCVTLGLEFPSIKIAGQKLGVDKLRVGLICRGKLLHTKGLHFRYL